MTKIIPSILAKTSEEFEKLLRIVEPYVDRVHLDIGDGDFVLTKTISGYEELMIMETKVKFDVHLMVSRPEDQMYFWYKTKADRFLIHAETDHGHRNLVESIHLNGRKVGLVLNPETQIEKIFELMDNIDFVQFMTVHPGNYGGEFVESVIDKILDFHGHYPDIPIMADGAIHSETARRLIAVGTSMLVVGTHILNEGKDVGKAIEELRKIGQNE
ncbi:MAG: hypothetical protein A2915_04710 [Candidatus Yanofskybacteria bacterium RIFCSPLOWO2_01_FULL_41_34]|uniref:Ribulose-phosphate 3-epimerase n=1 Tax=Candidatus Yanofskybacteria bacterium RIFCSPHIGHO2_01_FULL_41_26 TaxID=1802661 RepID=A0A1F8ED46_9BACT|nr:MAG: hypothetical protein A2649_04290 [Candidatus Yanofskybacteria bacterium RIFCSPHIGHO2_01_FULL_41_26]OGN21989.1 MAG: hypothetical protein A2915_04710 [Candidatus Yanofskybacteria bacterium RIFCSPLOWO2_01_FULL_41_34]